MCAQYRVTLTEDEVKRLKQAGSKGIRNAKHVLYARALLLLDKGPFTKEHWTIHRTNIGRRWSFSQNLEPSQGKICHPGSRCHHCSGALR